MFERASVPRPDGDVGIGTAADDPVAIRRHAVDFGRRMGFVQQTLGDAGDAVPDDEGSVCGAGYQNVTSAAVAVATENDAIYRLKMSAQNVQDGAAEGLPNDQTSVPRSRYKEASDGPRTIVVVVVIVAVIVASVFVAFAAAVATVAAAAETECAAFDVVVVFGTSFCPEQAEGVNLDSPSENRSV